ncbi:MAG: penicillin-binding transpeptidase domain-containing protein [Anaeromicrobium sp.]|jgi:stage V sporulation protein D (sporulation-specific penicillin-binding protein)|uniref:peptidoglycan D,D-transpeptidase FtsI family protein n=1 Tax=Anaeromicrobium sp. TaxID=1929132 RepID=UPI0025E396E8|nr:penicillin-binding transpeptidase domain-containing protein [Anaeromicrobium sp.]MCT4592789.1 penicillin-binding transpeptidase domain-containing protein [Anaeromicrobium sp.]
MFIVKRKGLVSILVFISCIAFVCSYSYISSNAMSQKGENLKKTVERGIIYDRNKKELATNMSTSTIWSKLGHLSNSTKVHDESKEPLKVTLTIDENIQNFTEKAIDNALAKTESKRAMAIVMDPKTGDILAMSVKSRADLNNPVEPIVGEEKDKLYNEIWTNPMIRDTYEPGSTFKLITAAACLEEGIVSPNSTFTCNGFSVVEDEKINCWRHYRPHGEQSFTEGVQNSCNPIFIEIGQKLGKEKYYKYLDSFGFTSTTDIDLAQDRKSFIQDKNIISPIEFANMSYGQGISVTPLQLISAISAIGNDGKLMKPRIVKELVDSKGNIINKYEPNMVRQVISKETAKELGDIMESVVSHGSGNKAYIPGYRVGGKTGTANKLIDGKYVEGKTYSSFVSLAPVNDPKLGVLVVIDEPQGFKFGSLTAAPAVKEIMQNTLAYLGVKKQSEKLGVQ